MYKNLLKEVVLLVLATCSLFVCAYSAYIQEWDRACFFLIHALYVMHCQDVEKIKRVKND